MRTTSKIRRQSWKPRTRFAMKAKPRVKRGSIKLRKERQWKIATAKGGLIRGNSLGKIQETAAAGHKAGRRVKPKRETPRVIHPERSGSGHERERLHGKAREQRRAEIFARAQWRCEEMVDSEYVMFRIHGKKVRCPNRATEWSHLKHGPRKCDCMACGIASCHDCHVKRHAGGNGKPCPKKEKALCSLKQAT